MMAKVMASIWPPHYDAIHSAEWTDKLSCKQFLSNKRHLHITASVYVAHAPIITNWNTLAYDASEINSDKCYGGSIPLYVASILSARVKSVMMSQ